MEFKQAKSDETQKILAIKEDHFNEVKSKLIKPSKLQEAFVSFANTDGGDLYVGIKDIKEVRKNDSERVDGFKKPEEANDLIHTLLEETEPAVEGVNIEYIATSDDNLLLHFSIPKSPKVHYTTQKKCFIRLNARKKEIKGQQIVMLGYAKGAYVYEKQAVEHIEVADIIESKNFVEYMEKIGSKLDPIVFLRKQRLLSKKDNILFPNVACVLLYDDEPQAALDNKCAIKIYRLRTSDEQYSREHLEGKPITINGSVENQIYAALDEIAGILADASYSVEGKLVKLDYPTEAIKEILVNAVIHRDYSLSDDIHIVIYDNRINIQSPGKLPGYITIDNIYDERYSRNPTIVRMLHNLPNPVNYDIGEGLNTARNELKKVGLREPEIEELENSLLVSIKHQKIATLEDIILNYLQENPGKTIKNKIVREISGVGDVNKVKKAFRNLRKQGLIEVVDSEASYFDYKYRLKDINE